MTRKKAVADEKSFRRIFTSPERKNSTLSQIEQEISTNIQGFLKSHIVSGDLTPADLEKYFSDSRIPDDPIFVSEQADFLLSKVVAQSVHTSSPSFVGHMTSAIPYFMLPLGKIMMGLNQNLVKIETSKAFTPLERQVLGMLHRLVYAREDSFYNEFVQHRDHSLGSFCSGGTVANISALWVARNQLLGPKENFAGVAKLGLASALQHYGWKNITILVSERGHYSLAKACEVLGIGTDNLVPIQTDASNKINIKSLRQKAKELNDAGTKVCAIVGVAGTTETGNVDPLDALADVAEEVGCFYHVDAAWGGPTLFSKKHAHLLRGINRADSVTFDAHKQLYVPMGVGLVLFKDPTALSAIEHHAPYIMREGSRDLGKHSLEGSRPGMAMMVHSALRIIGRKGYELLIDHGLAKAGAFANTIDHSPDFELITKPELNLLTYRYVPKKLLKKMRQPGQFTRAQLRDINEWLNELTMNIQKDQRAAGKTFVSRTTLNPQIYDRQSVIVFRAVLANPLTTAEILAEMLNEQRGIAQRWLETRYHDFLSAKNWF